MPSSMGDASHTAAGRGGSEARDYETRDANVGAVLGFLAALALILGATFFGTWLVFRYFAVASREPNPGSSFADVRHVPVGPQLQVNPRQDLLKSYDEQQQLLEGYSWQDRKAGTVRIPIERAMDLLLQKGFPVISSAAPSDTLSEDSPTRKVRGEAGEQSSDQAKGAKGREGK